MSYVHTLPARDDVARAVAHMLLEIEAVHIRPHEPFTFTSGTVSPVYIDCRKIISFPRVRSAVMDFAAATVMRDAGFEAFDVIAGGETAGIPFAGWMAERMGLPMVYVRKKPKGFGRDARIEGAMRDGARVLLVEDLTTDGGSKIGFAEAIGEAGAKATATFSVFYYDTFPDAPATLEAAGMDLLYLSTWWNVLEAARERGQDDGELREAEAFLRAPKEWSVAHGGPAD